MQRSLMSQSKVSIALKLRAIDEEKGGVVLEKEKHFGWLSEMVTARNLDIEVKAGCKTKAVETVYPPVYGPAVHCHSA